MPDRLDYAIRGGEKQVNMCIQTGSVNVCCQGDREGRPGNRRLHVKQAIWYCRGDPRGRPGTNSQTLALFIGQFQHLVDDTILDRLGCAHIVITLRIMADTFEWLTSMMLDDLVHQIARM